MPVFDNFKAMDDSVFVVNKLINNNVYTDRSLKEMIRNRETLQILLQIREVIEDGRSLEPYIDCVQNAINWENNQ